MSGHDNEDAWADVAAELVHWRAAGRRPRLFLRDDDAVSDTPALRRLLALVRHHDVPLLLASIPAHADASLGRLAGGEPLVTGAVHGWAHVSHSPIGQKPCELGRDRPIEIVLAEIARGREILGELLGGRLSGLLVPPWNRIHREVLERIGEAGFAGVSAHGWLEAPAPVTPVNVHVDIIHWSGGRVGRDIGWIAAELLRNLQIARRKGFRAVGILTHHLTHDEQAWAGIEAILGWFAASRADWVSADSLIGEPAEPIAGAQA